MAAMVEGEGGGVEGSLGSLVGLAVGVARASKVEALMEMEEEGGEWVWPFGLVLCGDRS